MRLFELTPDCPANGQSRKSYACNSSRHSASKAWRSFSKDSWRLGQTAGLPPKAAARRHGEWPRHRARWRPRSRRKLHKRFNFQQDMPRCDKDFAFEDLGNAVRKVSLDLGRVVDKRLGIPTSAMNNPATRKALLDAAGSDGLAFGGRALEDLCVLRRDGGLRSLLRLDEMPSTSGKTLDTNQKGRQARRMRGG
jgi:hypothetical protein